MADDKNPRMFVIKRKGNREPVSFGKIQTRIQWMKEHPFPLDHVNDTELSQIVIQSLRNDIHTSEIDVYAANLCASMSTVHMNYGVLAGRIAINNHHKNTLNSFRDKVDLLYMRKDTQTGEAKPLVTDEFYKFVKKYHLEIEKAINYERDYLIDFFGFKSMESSYLLRLDGRLIERPQDTFMRMAIHLHIGLGNSPEKTLALIVKTYDSVSTKYYTHASPTLFNSGTPNGNLSSCFLLGSDDSHEGILKTLTDCTKISKWSGGIGFHFDWRGGGSHISGTNGASAGVVPFLKMFNEGAVAFNQGGKRNGSFASYIEPHHPDIFKFLSLRRNDGDEKLRCRDLFIAVWVSDLFMKRVRDDAEWSVFCPKRCPLKQVWGEEYEQRYLEYESAGKASAKYKARDVWRAIFESQKESGMPYILFKDACNRSSMQQNIGTIHSSNLCSEITLYSDSKEYGTCFPAGTMVLTESGYVPIEECDGKHVMSPLDSDEEMNFFMHKEVCKVISNGEKQLVNIHTGVTRDIEATEDHRFLVYIGKGDIRKEGVGKRMFCWKRVTDLKIGDSLVMPAPQVLNGFRNDKSGYSQFYIQYGMRYFEQGCCNWMDAFRMKWNARHYSQETITASFLCGLFTRYAKINSTGLVLDFSQWDVRKEVEIQRLLRCFGVHSVLSGDQLVIRHYDSLLNFISYVGLDSSRKQQKLITLISLFRRNHRDFFIAPVLKLTKTRVAPVYDLCVPQAHNFIVEGVIVHNCNLASICLQQFVEDALSEEEIQNGIVRELNHEFPRNPVFNYKKLAEITGDLVVNLNNVVDKNYYPVVESARSNLIHRPLGIGIQGLADVFLKFRVPFESEEAKHLNKSIFETIYYAATSKSSEICREIYMSAKRQIASGKSFTSKVFPKEIRSEYPELKKDEAKYSKTFSSVEELPTQIGAYPTFSINGGSPLFNGKFHWELFGLKREDLVCSYDWETLREHVAKFGVRNCLTIALMPTAGTSQIMGSSSCFEPYESNIFVRKTISGEFIVVNKYLIHDLQRYGLWNSEIQKYLIACEGSIQNIEGIPQELKELYKTVWEIKQRSIIDLAADRQPFVDHSQSMNLFLNPFTFDVFTSVMFHGWKKGLKTGSYYVYTKPAITPQKFTIEVGMQEEIKKKVQEDRKDYRPVYGEEVCLMCGS